MQNRPRARWLAPLLLLYCGLASAAAAGYGGIPGYPGAKAVSHLTARSGGFEVVNLVSADPPAAVRKWYREHLPDWSYVGRYDAFFRSRDQVTEDRVFKVPSIKVVADDGSAIDAVVSGVKGIRTRIQIVYRP